MVFNLVCYINNPYGDRGCVGIGPTQDLVDEYQLKDGTPAPAFSQKDNGEVFDVNTSKIYENR